MTLLLLAVSTFLSEDLALIAAGALVARGEVGFAAAVIACAVGITVGDLLLYAAGRLGAARWIAPERFAQASAWLEARGFAVVFLSRFTPGLRLPTYLAAGALRTSAWRFAAYFAVASAVWTPVVVGLSALVGEATAEKGLASLIAVPLVLLAAKKLATRNSRRRLVGWWRRKTRWEFWPAWAAYALLAPYLIWLAIRFRTVTGFMRANPGIPGGGLTGESKSDILRQLARAGEAVPWFALVTSAEGLEYPVVLKPDVGERGRGVAVIRSREEAERYLAAACGPVIAQEYVGGEEFGVFYVRGRVTSITAKRFPAVTGDGRRTVEELILDDDRAVCLADAYLRACRRPADSVPAAGEAVQLVELGSHCRGAIFLDAGHLLTPELEAEIDRVAKCHEGFYYGRFDVRAESEAALRAGRFKVLELNGVAAEPAHIYDPAVGIWEAYRVLGWHWREAFRIGVENGNGGRDRGLGLPQTVRRANGAGAVVQTAD